MAFLFASRGPLEDEFRPHLDHPAGNHAEAITIERRAVHVDEARICRTNGRNFTDPLVEQIEELSSDLNVIVILSTEAEVLQQR